ncbi:MAG TPA: DinB family protein [Bryobacteraceae bacterium]|nr:DinB family protein [Bryobacteraceae bacterium]
MSIGQALLPEFEVEMANTRKTLERVPDDKMAWTPHPKSFPMGTLARHVADLPGWITHTLAQDELEIGDFPGYPPPGENRRQDLLARFDKNVAEARAALSSVNDEAMFRNWSLLFKGQKMMTMPKIAVLRSFAMNHLIHHRAQLGVYLRLNDVPVPGLYGPSADEKFA